MPKTPALLALLALLLEVEMKNSQVKLTPLVGPVDRFTR